MLYTYFVGLQISVGRLCWIDKLEFRGERKSVVHILWLLLVWYESERVVYLCLYESTERLNIYCIHVDAYVYFKINLSPIQKA